MTQRSDPSQPVAQEQPAGKTAGSSALPVRIIRTCLPFLAFSLIIAIFFRFILSNSASGEESLYITFYLVGTQDVLWLLMATLALPVLWGLSGTRMGITYSTRIAQVFTALSGRLKIASHARLPRFIFPGAVFSIAAAGTFLVYHGYALSMDEYVIRFQARIFREGLLLAPVPNTWIELTQALRPGFLEVNRELFFWTAGYRPGTAMLHAAANLVGLGTVLNAILCGGCVWLVSALARREWPDEKHVSLWAALLLAVSPQFLVTGMTFYAMTAHLFAGLLWLYFFTGGRLSGHIAAILTGCIAIGLHQIHVHPFFALPFLAHLLFAEKRWKLFTAYAAAYTIAAGLWTYWIEIAVWLQGLAPAAPAGTASTAPPPAGAGSGDGTAYLLRALTEGLKNHSALDLLHWATNTARFTAWQNLALLPLLAAAFFHWRAMPPRLRLLAWSVAATLLPYLILMPAQGHGWGYRYIHPVLGNLALLAVFGWIALRRTLPEDIWPRFRRFAAALVILTALVGLPLRFLQVEAFIRPFAAASTHLETRQADIVFLHAEDIWYGRDLVRNDPFLQNRPLILSIQQVPEHKLAVLCAPYETELVNAASLAPFGIKHLGQMPPDMKRWGPDELRDRLTAAGCRSVTP